MDDAMKCVIVAIIAAAVFLSVLVIGCCWYHREVYRIGMEQGYSEHPFQGTGGTYWSK